MWKKTRISLFIILWGILLIPLVEQQTNLIPQGTLRGQADPAAYPTFRVQDWFSGDFQERFDRATEENLGFRNSLIRFKNQLEYSLFNRANASGVVVGKKKVLYEKDYLRAYQGKDYLGDRYWKIKFDRLSQVCDTLTKLGKQFILILEPGKGTYQPEGFPKRFKVTQDTSANYRAILLEARRIDLPILDLNSLFAKERFTSAYPLFPKGGIHWSYAGMLRAADTIYSFVNAETRFNLGDLVIGDIRFSKKLSGTDNDLAELLNVVIEPAHPKMAYPQFHVVMEDSTAKPRVLDISDSFYFNLLNNKVFGSVFKSESFWYYNKTIYPDTWNSLKETVSVMLEEVMEQTDLIFLMVTERFYYKFDWNFVDDLFSLYYPDHGKDYFYDYVRMIIGNFEWFDNIYAQAEWMNEPMEDRLAGNAGYQFWVDDQKEPFARDLAYYKMKILSDVSRMRQIAEKARVNQIPVEEQVERDAAWLVAQDSR